jgi:hypothetical protein
VEHLVYTNLIHGSEIKVLMNAFTQFNVGEISNVNRYLYSSKTTVDPGEIALMTFSNLHGSIYADLKISYGASTFVFLAFGGTVTTYTDGGITYKVHTFTSSGDFTVTSGGSVDYLIVAGGGGGKSHGATDGSGGGGAGGFLCSVDTSGGPSLALSQMTLIPSIYSVVVGDGGPANGGKGNDSIFNQLIAVGGGGGGPNTPSDDGGSGGGAGGLGTANQGNNGAPYSGNGSGGGGGAGETGFYSASGGGNGGDGLQTSIKTGTLEYFAGGGGGGGYNTSSGGSGGLGGGGDGGSNTSNGQDGTPSTGGGGGGSKSSTISGAGGSGIVIIRYRI